MNDHERLIARAVLLERELRKLKDDVDKRITDPAHMGARWLACAVGGLDALEEGMHTVTTNLIVADRDHTGLRGSEGRKALGDELEAELRGRAAAEDDALAMQHADGLSPTPSAGGDEMRSFYGMPVVVRAGAPPDTIVVVGANDDGEPEVQGAVVNVGDPPPAIERRSW